MANFDRRACWRSAAGRSSALIASLLFVLAAITCPSPCRADNPVFDFLMNRGVQVSPDETVRLPAPDASRWVERGEPASRHRINLRRKPYVGGPDPKNGRRPLHPENLRRSTRASGTPPRRVVRRLRRPANARESGLSRATDAVGDFGYRSGLWFLEQGADDGRTEASRAGARRTARRYRVRRRRIHPARARASARDDPDDPLEDGRFGSGRVDPGSTVHERR